MLETTVESVSSALKRARATLEGRRPSRADVTPAAGSPAEQALVERFVAAYETSDVDALVALLSDDVFVSMPPVPHEYVGREPAARFCGRALSGRSFSLVPTRANGQPAFGVYVRSADGRRHGTGLLVLELAGERITAMTRFEPEVFAGFGLPATWSPGPE
jgi:RNA polymerase sigma-70 factor (ECF subfamily)